jgi:hypothetical protein
MLNGWVARMQFALGVCLVLGLSGCNRENLPGLGRVSGTVTMDGKPVPNATIVFESVAEKSGASVGLTDASGKYELYYSRGNKGATQGEHVVRINTFSDAGEGGTLQRETVPSKYNVESELKSVVKGGTNVANFELKSGGTIVQPNEDPTTGKKKGRSVTGCG